MIHMFANRYPVVTACGLHPLQTESITQDRELIDCEDCISSWDYIEACMQDDYAG